MHVEIARAHDRLEAIVWQKVLENQGYEVRTERRGGIIHAILYLGRVPQAVLVPEKDAEQARKYLKDSGFIR
jgi:hypothetical protein